MKRIVLSVLGLMLLVVTSYAEMETWDIQVDSYTMKKVQVGSSAYVILVSTAEIWASTTTSPVGWNPLYRMVCWTARHDCTVPLAITPNNLQPVDQILPLKSDEIYREEEYKSFVYGKFNSTLTGTATVYISIGYKKIR